MPSSQPAQFMNVSQLVFSNKYILHSSAFDDTCWLVPWLSGIALVFDWRTFPVLCSTCSRRMTTYVGKPSAVGQPTRPTQPFIFSG